VLGSEQKRRTRNNAGHEQTAKGEGRKSGDDIIEREREKDSEELVKRVVGRRKQRDKCVER
jgi:hypothetical protein